METICAICGWHTPCHGDGAKYACIDVEMCRQNVRINELTKERNAATTALAQTCEVVQALLRHNDGRQLGAELQTRIVVASDAAARALKLAQPGQSADEQSNYEVLRDALVELLDPADDDVAEVAILIQAVEDLKSECDELWRICEAAACGAAASQTLERLRALRTAHSDAS